MSTDGFKEKSISDLESGDLHLRETQIKSEVVHEGVFLHMRRDQVQLPNGHTAIREYLTHPGAVAIVPLLSDGRVLLERQYRYPIQQSVIEIPAGKLDSTENQLDCAKRELKEETGYTAQNWHFLGRIHPVISYSTEFIDIYLAENLTPGARSLDDEEFLDVFAASLEEIQNWIRQGIITDVKTIIASYWLQDHLRQKM